MARNKKSDLTDEELLAMLKKRWKKAESLEEIQTRAKQGHEKFDSNHCSLNDIWNVYKKYPETFLFREYVAGIQRLYMGSHTYQHGNHEVQEFNMQNAISRIVKVVESIYGDVETQLKALQESLKQQENRKVVEKEEETWKNTSKANLFDDEEDKKLANNFACHGKINKEAYRQFNANVTTYIHGKMLNTNLQNNDNEVSIQTKVSAKESQKFHESFFEKIEKLPASKFVKGSKEMAEISEMAADYLQTLTAPFVENGTPEEEIQLLIDENLEKFYAIVDEKRAENSKKAVAARIQARIESGVKYKNAPQKDREQRSFNPFENGREL